MTKKLFSYPILTVEVVHSSDATIATITGVVDGEEFVWQGTAKRHPTDRWLHNVGLKLALSRALLRAAKQLAKQGNGIVKSVDDNAARPRVPQPKVHTIKGVQRGRRPVRANTPAKVIASS